MTKYLSIMRHCASWSDSALDRGNVIHEDNLDSYIKTLSIAEAWLFCNLVGKLTVCIMLKVVNKANSCCFQLSFNK
jgi:hypothetical protein